METTPANNALFLASNCTNKGVCHEMDIAVQITVSCAKFGSSIANRAMCGNDTLITPFLQIGIIEICRRTEDVKTITMNSIQWDIDVSKLCKLLIKARQSASLKNLTS